MDDEWAVDDENRVEGEVHVCLVTTAWRLYDIFYLDGRQNRLVWKVSVWRHHLAALKYLKNARGKAPDRQYLDKKIEEYETLEKASSKEIQSIF